MTDRSSADAVFFDMDGTLIDSEPLSDILILQVLEKFNLPAPDFSLAEFHGTTWASVEARLVGLYPQLAGEALAARLEQDFHALLVTELPPLIRGARRALQLASAASPVGVVSSSPRKTIEAVLERAGVTDLCTVVIGAEDVQRPKPDPQCYLLAAGRAAVDPPHCLVFEDSSAGIQAALAAGMETIGVIGNREANAAAEIVRGADLVIGNYDELPENFFCTRHRLR